MTIHRKLRLLAGFASAWVWSLSLATLSAQPFYQTNLVSDVPGLAATTDPNLINPWGMAFSATSPFWVADQGSSLSTLYTGAGAINPIVVTIPGGPTPPFGATGVVQNGATGFDLPSTTTASHFIFDTLNGTIAAWASGTIATTVAATPGAVYTGLAEATNSTGSYLYAANSAGTGSINVFNSSFAPVALAGSFTDPSLPAGYVPFNIQAIGSDLYVTYAELGAHGVPVPGSAGFVVIYDTSGNFIQQLVSFGALDAPWGITLAPAGFDQFGGDLLVGNFGNGEINAFDPTTGAYIGTIDGANNLPIVNQDLWALDFRTGGTGDNPDTLYFTAGIDNQTEGLFGEIATTPEPSSFILAGLGLLALTVARLRPQPA